MAETLKFGPEWLRALSHDDVASSPPVSPAPATAPTKFKLAEYRYGREEMLALFNNETCKMPDELEDYMNITFDKCQQPLAFIPLSEEEQHNWTRCVNSDVAMKLAGRGSNTSSVVPPSRGSASMRGGSVDRGRGRGRGGSGYNSSGSRLIGDDVMTDGSPRPIRSYERSHSLHDRNQPWDDSRERKFDKGFVNRGFDENGSVSPRKDHRSFDNWRSANHENHDNEDDGWRSTTKTKGVDKWGRGNWRTHHDEIRSDYNQRPFNKQHRIHDDGEKGSFSDQLPEWSKDDEPDYDCFGSFDASGAFRENQQRNKEKDEAAGKISKEREKDKALKSTDENHNKNDETPPKHSISSHDDIQSTESIAEELWDVDDVKESNVLPSLTVSSSSNSSLSSNFSSSDNSNKQSSDQSNSGFDHKTKPDPCVNVPKSDNKIITHETDDTKCDESVVNNRINNNPPQEADFDHLQKAAESLMAKWIEEEEAKTSVSSSKPSLPVLPPKASTQQSSCSTQKTVIPLPLEDKNALKWYYCDPQGQVQGPFVSEEMSDWLNAGYFNMSLLIRRGCDNKFLPLGDLMKLWGRSPFSKGCPDPPPIRCSNAVPEAQKQKQPVSSESGGVSQPTKENEDLRLLQQQLLPYQLVQQRFLQEQQNLLWQQVQVMNQLEQRGFELLLNHQQQQQLLLQYIIAQQLQQQQRPLAAVPETATSTSVPQDPVQQFLSRVAFAHHPLLGPDLKRFIDDKRKDASYKDIIKAISERFCSSSTTPFNRFKLSELRQRNGESVDDYVNRLRSQARFCNYKCTGCGASQEDHVLFDVILRNTAQSQLRSRVFERGLATLEELLLAARNLEIASRQSEQMNVRNSSKSVIDAVTSSASGTDRGLTKFRKTRSKNMGPISQLTSKVRKDIRCKFCDQRHLPERSKCPANGKKCTKCDQLHHFAVCCNSSRKEESDRTSTHTVSSVTSKDCAYHVNGGKQAFTSLRIHGVQHKFLIDSGATENIIPGEIAGADCKMEPCPSVRCYSGAKIQPLGRTKLEVALSNGQELLLSFMVVKKGIPLLCLRDCVRLGFLTLGEQVHHVTSLSHDSPEISRLLQKYSSLFHSDLGCVKGVKAHIQIKDGVSPRFFRNRSVPLALRDRVDAEIDSMIKRGTLHEVKTSKWASPVVIVPKPDGQLRLCADYTATLAKVVDTEAYPLPRPEELLSELSGNSVFSKLDLRTCFEQFELDEESKPLLTVNTSRGLLQYNRLPYGISSAPAIVQRAMEDLLRGINVQVYLDDILVASSSMSQHLETLAELFKRLQSANLRLRLDKCEFAKPKVKYLGFIISGEGTSPDPEKVRAIDRFPVPSSIHELRSFLGLVRFYEKFVHSLSDIAKPLYLLLKKDAPWIWEAEQHNAFLRIKAALISPPCLHHFNASMSIVLATDASPVGVSAVLSHRDHEGHEFPVAFASRSLSACEMRYAQIDREALAIVYGVKKFRNYLLGRRFTLVTDHQPLQSIFGCKKGLPSLTTARLHRYSLFLLSYDFTVEYRPGIKNSNADALSRAPVDSPCDDPDETEEFLGACLATVKFRHL